MKLYLKQRIFTWGDQFTVYDESGNGRYFVQGEIFTFGKKLHICDPNGNELAFIRQKVFSFLPRYYISVNGNDVAEIVKEFTFFTHNYSVNGLGWSVSGDFLAHDYTVSCDKGMIASVTKKWFTWGDAYEIDISSSADEVTALAVTLVIDACIDNANNSNN